MCLAAAGGVIDRKGRVASCSESLLDSEISSFASSDLRSSVFVYIVFRDVFCLSVGLVDDRSAFTAVGSDRLLAGAFSFGGFGDSIFFF